MLDFLRKHTIVIMAAMALVFVGLMFIGGDVSGGSLSGMFKQTFVTVDGKSYGEKDYVNMGQTGRNLAYSFSSSFAPLLQNHFATEQDLRNICYLMKTNNPNAAFLAYCGIIRREAERLGLTPSNAEIDEAICNIPEFLDDKGVFDPKKYDDFISMRGNQGKKLQEEILRGLMGDTMSLVRIEDVIAGGAAVEPNFAQAVAESENQQITVNTAFLEKSAFRPKTDPGEEEIKTFWDKHKENYRNEEARFFTVYTFTPEGDAQGSQARRYFQRHHGNHELGGKRHLGTPERHQRKKHGPDHRRSPGQDAQRVQDGEENLCGRYPQERAGRNQPAH